MIFETSFLVPRISRRQQMLTNTHEVNVIYVSNLEQADDCLFTVRVYKETYHNNFVMIIMLFFKTFTIGKQKLTLMSIQ